MNYHHLADLARTVKKSPVVGVCAYKPPNSDAGGDLYVMDFIGMFGIPLVPVSKYPEEAKVIFLPTQAAKDQGINEKIKKSLNDGVRIIMTAGFLAEIRDGDEILKLADITGPVKITPVQAGSIIDNGVSVDLTLPLNVESRDLSTGGKVLLEAQSGGKRIPYLIENNKGNVLVLNSHTYSQADFDAVGEVLLCPNPLGMLELPESWTNIIRDAFNTPLDLQMEAPVKVSLQTLANGDMVIHNYNDEKIRAAIKLSGGTCMDVITKKEIQVSNGIADLDMPARSRLWLKKKN